MVLRNFWQLILSFFLDERVHTRIILHLVVTFSKDFLVKILPWRRIICRGYISSVKNFFKQEQIDHF